MQRAPALPIRLFRSAAAIAVSLALALSACGDDSNSGEAAGDQTATTAAVPDKLEGSVASYDLAVGPPGRFIIGIFNQNRGPVGYGTVSLRFSFLGADKADGAPEPGPSASASYLPLPGSPPPPADTSQPSYLSTDQRGVYAAQVAFDKAGLWSVEATVDLDGAKSAETAFTVLPKHEVPAVGDPAVPSENLTVSTPDAPPGAIDSRASPTTPVPDAELHQTTVRQALREKRPVLLVISTPTYCVSQFCGPITDMIQDLAKEYPDRARFIHVEVWKNYEAKEFNDAAKEWIARGDNVNEPWTFLIGADGKITARFDNVATRAELEPLLQALPATPS